MIRDNFCSFCIKRVVTPHLNRLVDTVQMRGHNIWFRGEIGKIVIKYSLLSRALLWSLWCVSPVSINSKSKVLHFWLVLSGYFVKFFIGIAHNAYLHQTL